MKKLLLLCLAWLVFAASVKAADWKLEPVENIGGIEIFSIPDPDKPEFQRLLAKPAGDGPFPAVVVNHGGRSGADFIHECLAFPANGFVAIACDLRHKEIPVEDFRNFTWEPGMGPGTSTEDIRRNREEIKILTSLPFVDKYHLAMYGHSGGGHLTVGFLALGNQDQAISVGAVTSAGIYPTDPDHLKNPRKPGEPRVFPQLDHVRAMSPPIESIKEITVPLLSIHGRLDHICPEESADTLHEEMDRLGLDNTLIVREEADHNDTKTPADFEEIIRYFRENLGLATDESHVVFVQPPARAANPPAASGSGQQQPSRPPMTPAAPPGLVRIPEQMAPLPETSRRQGGDAASWVDPVKDAPAGTLYKTCPSQTIRGEYSYLVYLPPDYETNTGRKYPVIYFLHGGGGTQRTGEYFVMDYVAAMNDGQAPEAILILVNGVGGSSFCDSFDGKKPVESVIVNDLIPHVDATYRTRGTREMRAIEGFSMGGFGSLHLAMKYPELFSSVTAIAHAPIRPNSGWDKIDAAFRNGPFSGNVEYFNANDPFQLIEKNAAAVKEGTTLRFIAGDKDNPNTQARTREFHEKAQSLGMETTLTVVPGVAHNCPKIYEKLGEPAFAYYQQVFAANQPEKADQP